jgi:outer membrane protein OmpA-like peptidoglycan-associated protein
MVFNTRTAAVVIIGSLVLTGCATRGALRTAVEEQQAALEAGLAAERAERMAADERLASDLASLRSDLSALRQEFSAEIEAVAQGLQFALPVHFAFDDATVRFEDYDALERFTRIVNRHYPGSLVTVEGFADPAGTAAYNRALSQRRAEAVRDHLVDAQIQAQVRAVGYGQDRLVVPGAAKDDPGAQLNRRVVFVIESPPRPEAVATTSRLEG